jgi:leader peptidase (prepilin peptidase)/N-methyltransferase
MLIVSILAFLFGTIYGSFLNMLLWRLPQYKELGGRSQCRSCHHILAWYDLVPIFSFITLRGRCRYCSERISKRYPLVELTTGIVLGIFFFIWQPTLNLESVITIIGLLVLISLFFFDLFYFILPDIFIFPAIALYAVYAIVKTSNPSSYFLTALLSAGFFAILYGVSRGKKLGFGDVKLAFLLGLIFGYPVGFMVIVLGVWLAALVAIGLLITKQAIRTDPIPLGSFLTLSAIISLIFYHGTLPFISLFR